MASQRLWRARESRGDRLPAPSQCGRLRALPRRDDDRRGIDRLAGRHAANLGRWLGILLQMEHGLDARHIALHGARSHPSALSSRRHYVRPALRIFRAIHAAALPRRGRAWKALADRQDARRSMATLCQSADLSRLHVGTPRQEAVVHGRRDRPGGGMVARRRGRVVPPRRARPCRRPAAPARSQPPLCEHIGPASARLRSKRLSLAHRRRPGELGLRLPAPRRRRVLADPFRLQHDAGAAPRLSRRRAARRDLARDLQQRFRSLWRIEHGQRGRRAHDPGRHARRAAVARPRSPPALHRASASRGLISWLPSPRA